MGKQNVTLSLLKDLLRRAKIQAAREDKKLTKFAQMAIEKKLQRTPAAKPLRKGT